MAHQNHEYHEYIVEQTEKVIGIDSPTGYHYNVQEISCRYNTGDGV